MIFLIQSPHGWRDLWQRPHHLATRFAAAGHTVRWVEPRYLLWLITQNARFLRSRREHPVDRIEVQPVTLINGERFAPVRRWNRETLRAALGKPVPGVSGKDVSKILWLYNPHESHLIDEVAADLVVYDMMDEYLGFPWSPPQIRDEEQCLLREADWVFAGTQALYDAKRESAEGRIECVLSGVEASHFSKAREMATSGDFGEYPEIRRLMGLHDRLIGYAGMIDLRVDQEIMAMAAEKQPDWGFVLLGEARTDVTLLESVPNIHLLGPIPYDDLPAHYASWDVGLIPFRENRLTLHTNPTKILEYAAAGLPIVAPALPELERFYAEAAFLYHDDDEFLNFLELILRGDAPIRERESVRTRLECAAQLSEARSWDAIATQMLGRVEQLVEAKIESRGA